MTNIFIKQANTEPVSIKITKRVYLMDLVRRGEF